LKLDLSLLEQEGSAGAFSVDIVAEDGDGRQVVIENQLERTDHDHLGKLITYLSNLDAKTAVWITRDPRPEHERAIHWLNEVVPVDMAFYLVQIEAYRIADSPPAPLLTIVAGPSPEAREAGDRKKGLAERHLLRLDFWNQLLEKAKEQTSLHARISPSKENWVSAGAGKSGLSFHYVILMGDSQVALNIDVGDAEKNELIFDTLYAQKEAIEETFSQDLEWRRLEGRRYCSIRHFMPGSGLQDRQQWAEIHEQMIDAMVRLERALKPYIDRL
jgi:hypothetical protein